MRPMGLDDVVPKHLLLASLLIASPFFRGSPVMALPVLDELEKEL